MADSRNVARQCLSCQEPLKNWQAGYCSDNCYLTDYPKRRAQVFWSYVDKSVECWNWTAAKSRQGYGQFWYGLPKRLWLAHRLAYTLSIGPIEAGLTIDHLCRNRLCVNPAHLEAVSQKENILRSDSVSARAARKTHCDNGHQLTGDNMHKLPNGWRECRACDRNNHRRKAGWTDSELATVNYCQNCGVRLRVTYRSSLAHFCRKGECVVARQRYYRSIGLPSQTLRRASDAS